MNGPYCDHGRLLGACEDCAYEQAKADGRPVSGPHPSVVRERNEHARIGAMVVGPTEDTDDDGDAELSTNEQPVDVAQQAPAKAARTIRERRPAGKDVTP